MTGTGTQTQTQTTGVTTIALLVLRTGELKTTTTECSRTAAATSTECSRTAAATSTECSRTAAATSTECSRTAAATSTECSRTAAATSTSYYYNYYRYVLTCMCFVYIYLYCLVSVNGKRRPGFVFIDMHAWSNVVLTVFCCITGGILQHARFRKNFGNDMNNFRIISVWHHSWEAGLTPNYDKRHYISKISAEVNKEVSPCLFVLRFYGPVNPMESCRARSVYLTTRLLGRLSPLSG